MGKVILLRHGQTHSNIHGYLDTRPPGAELSELGRRQAHAVGEEFARELGEIPQWWSSMAIRTQQTSEIAARAFEQFRGLEPYTIPVQVTPGLYEVFAGDYEMSQDMGKSPNITSVCCGGSKATNTQQPPAVKPTPRFWRAIYQ
ncbi:phosphoglycerate mutase family protein [Corynebacterium propinquum]|uniref:phosphoglycerate mutase family protein n=1 Tax=Corynebacterium propinquum TaxID=43769 RepID=UPI003CC48F49